MDPKAGLLIDSITMETISSLALPAQTGKRLFGAEGWGLTEFWFCWPGNSAISTGQSSLLLSSQVEVQYSLLTAYIEKYIW